MRLSETTVKEHSFEIRRFLAWLGEYRFTLEEASRKVVRSYLKRFDDLSPYTYANVLKSLKRFFRDFLERPQIVSSFRFPVKPVTVKIIPSREDVERFYHALEKPIERALFLFYATSGLRRSEVTNLKFEDVDFEKRMVVPKYGQTRTKLRWISFFNEEAEKALHRYLATRKDRSNKLFRIGTHTFLDFWKRAYNKTGIHITPKVLREWFCAEMGYLGVPDRYVDAFCGRAPKSVLAKHYSDYSPKKLQEIYEKARLRVIDR